MISYGSNYTDLFVMHYLFRIVTIREVKMALTTYKGTILIWQQ